MSTNSPVSNTTPESTLGVDVSPKDGVDVKTLDVKDSNSLPEDKSKRDIEILDGVTTLCNTTLYVLTKGFYPGADAHLVNQAKEFVKEIKKDVESKRKLVSDGKAVNLG